MTDLVPPPAHAGKGLMERVEDALLPLINLVFLLLMFFIVAGQLAQEPLPELPGTRAEGQPQQPDADLMVRANGDWLVAGQAVAADQLAARLPAPEDAGALRIAAASSLSMAQLEELFRALEQAGFTEILLLTEPES
ncbi:ExbD/TolR family protein [Marinobacter qingdaonensis]|uniref:Biopolymer transporter ExbD n=1 Tax=Marinobacter qingdaonensis TaxID=3108486 RepID=A0ABU5NW74_9GAMM|nr:biopolymer transporter ExbD [Marinobacter sp. ASW11-75]MEA1080036.1 biopolymer transporter ExbD [Marinobacter sp. ASW11-75]